MKSIKRKMISLRLIITILMGIFIANAITAENLVQNNIGDYALLALSEKTPLM
jgi:hypothetical protein